MKDKLYKVTGIIVIIAVALFFVVKLLHKNLSGNGTEKKQAKITGIIRSQGKILVLRESFVVKNISSLEKKYFDNLWLKFASKINLEAKGTMQFEIDLSDTTHTKLKFTRQELVVSSRVVLTNFTLGEETIRWVAEAEPNPKVRAGKQRILQRLAEIALRERLEELLSKAKKQPMTKLESDLTQLAGIPVTLQLTGAPVLKQGMELIKTLNLTGK